MRSCSRCEGRSEMRRATKILIAASLISLAGGALADAFTDRYPDFACEVDKGPLSDEEKARIDNDYLMALGKRENGQELIDRIYARSTAGAMPKGFYRGAIIPARSEQNTEL